MAASIFASAFAAGGGSSSYGDFVVVRMQNQSFITTPMELQQASAWARGRVSRGVAHRDRTAFIERFETIIGHLGSAVATKGSRGVLSRILKSMKANALTPAEWNLPHDINDSVEIKKPVAKAPEASAGTCAPSKK
jgi:hypothetical protein